MNPIKSTPKSCSCTQCQNGKRSKAGKQAMKADERAHRHAAKVALRKGAEALLPAPKGNYFD